MSVDTVMETQFLFEQMIYSSQPPASFYHSEKLFRTNGFTINMDINLHSHYMAFK